MAGVSCCKALFKPGVAHLRTSQRPLAWGDGSGALAIGHHFSNTSVSLVLRCFAELCDWHPMRTL